jgi:hypothetical protein
MKDDGISCSSYNSGFFKAVMSRGDIQAIYCGHDHDNTFEGIYQNITLAFGLKTGYGGYEHLFEFGKQNDK